MDTKQSVVIVGKIRNVECHLECMRKAFGADVKVSAIIKAINNSK